MAVSNMRMEVATFTVIISLFLPVYILYLTDTLATCLVGRRAIDYLLVAYSIAFILRALAGERHTTKKVLRKFGYELADCRGSSVVDLPGGARSKC